MEDVCKEKRGRLENRWTLLPDHILEKILLEHSRLPDLFRFGLVCRPWKSVCDSLGLKDHLPWLMVPLINDNSITAPSSLAFNETQDVGLFSLREGKIYKAELPEVSNRHICGSFPGGWLMIVHGNSEIQLINPFRSSSEVIQLPALSKLPRVRRTIQCKLYNEDKVATLHYVVSRFDRNGEFSIPSTQMRDGYIKRVAMSSSSVTAGTIIMAIQSTEHALVYYRIGGREQVWAPVTLDLKHAMLMDLTYYEGKFYAVHHHGHVVVVNGLEKTSPPSSVSVEQVISEHPARRESFALRILESSGDLLVILRYFHKPDRSKPAIHSSYRTVKFKVFKLEFGTHNKWLEVKSLGDRSIFLGFNTSFSVQSKRSSGCKPNCIYFTDMDEFCCGKPFRGHDFGIFNLEDGSIQKFLHSCDNLQVMPPPVWLVPNLI